MLKKLLAKLKRKQAPKSDPVVTFPDIEAAAKAVLAPLPPKPKGKVIKQTRSPEFDPFANRHGGRIVKVMPRQLQQIKAAQEKVENDEQPKIEDIED